MRVASLRDGDEGDIPARVAEEVGIKRLIEETETDTEKFLYAMSSKFGRKVKSVDDMRGKTFGKNNSRELDHALSKIREKEKEMKNA